MTKLIIQEAKNAITYHDEIVKLLKNTAFEVFKGMLNLCWDGYLDRTIINVKKNIVSNKNPVRYERVLDEFIKHKYGNQYSFSIRPDKNSSAFYNPTKKEMVLNSDHYIVTTANLIEPLNTFRNIIKNDIKSPDDFKFEYCVFNNENIKRIVSTIIHEMQHIEQDYYVQPTANTKDAHFLNSRSNDTWHSGNINSSKNSANIAKYAVHFTKNIELQAIANEMVSMTISTLFPDGDYQKKDNAINGIDYNKFRDTVMSNMSKFVAIFGKK